MNTLKETVVFLSKWKFFLVGVWLMALAVFLLFFWDMHDSLADYGYYKRLPLAESSVSLSSELDGTFRVGILSFDESTFSKPQRVSLPLADDSQRQISSEKKELRPIHQGSPQQQEYIDYAWDQYHDKNFIYLLKAENGLITPDRMHPRGYYCKKRIAHDWGFGGISDCYHPKITSDPRFLTDWKWQMDQLYQLYISGTKFYSRPHWKAQSKYFTWTYL